MAGEPRKTGLDQSVLFRGMFMHEKGHSATGSCERKIHKINVLRSFHPHRSGRLQATVQKTTLFWLQISCDRRVELGWILLSSARSWNCQFREWHYGCQQRVWPLEQFDRSRSRSDR